jgi:S-formylglutathione hydrolase FrmB
VQSAAAPVPYFYISCGTQDSLLEINRTFVALLKERALAHQYREAPGLGHVWALWDEDVGVFFDLLKSRGLSRAN